MANERDAIDNAIWGLEFTAKQLEGYLKGFEGDSWFAQPCPGANHALWQVGHLAYAYHGLGAMLGDMGELPESYEKLFGMGSEPATDKAGYPAPESVVSTLWAMRERVVSHVREMSPERFSEKIKDEGMFQTPGQVAGLLAIHDGIHAGQLTMIRKHLGMDRVFG